jgi:hypothetical protein
MIRRLTIAAAAALLTASTLNAQGREIHILSVQATPIGALPPVALPMPASRNHHYWGVRLQTGRRTGGGDVDLNAVAAGLDLQYRGGSTFGLTAGYQSGDCGAGDSDCSGHALFGARTRINLFTGGPTVAGIIGDYSATSTIGTEIGFGWAPHVLPGLSACTIDFGMPFSVAMLETVRLVSFITPGVVWDIDCSDEGAASRASYLTGLGFGFQQIGHRGFDIYLGVQKIFLGQTGYQFGVSATFVRLPWGR